MKTEIFCEALGSVPVLLNTLPPCLAMLFWQAGKTFQVPVGEGGFLLIARHKVITKISFENQIAVGHESQISLISIWISLSIEWFDSFPSVTSLCEHPNWKVANIPVFGSLPFRVFYFLRTSMILVYVVHG